MKINNFFIIKKGETYSCPCPFCQKDTMKFKSDQGAMKLFQCKSCGQELLYGGKMNYTRAVDEQMHRLIQRRLV